MKHNSNVPETSKWDWEDLVPPEYDRLMEIYGAYLYNINDNLIEDDETYE